MEKKEKKLPNRTDIPIDIPNVKVEKKHPYYNRNDTTVKSYTFTASSIPSDWLKEIEQVDEMIKGAKWFFTPNERKESAKANLRLKSKKLLDKPFSASNAYNLFGAEKFPNAIIQCYKCGNKIEYVVDFFIHCILDHGSSLQETEIAFQNVLDRI